MSRQLALHLPSRPYSPILPVTFPKPFLQLPSSIPSLYIYLLIFSLAYQHARRCKQICSLQYLSDNIPIQLGNGPENLFCVCTDDKTCSADAIDGPVMLILIWLVFSLGSCSFLPPSSQPDVRHLWPQPCFILQDFPTIHTASPVLLMWGSLSLVWSLLLRVTNYPKMSGKSDVGGSERLFLSPLHLYAFVFMQFLLLWYTEDWSSTDRALTKHWSSTDQALTKRWPSTDRAGATLISSLLVLSKNKPDRTFHWYQHTYWW